MLIRHVGLKTVTLQWIAEAQKYHPQDQQIQENLNQIN